MGGAGDWRLELRLEMRLAVVGIGASHGDSLVSDGSLVQTATWNVSRVVEGGRGLDCDGRRRRKGPGRFVFGQQGQR
jgi:hypothetical protein